MRQPKGEMRRERQRIEQPILWLRTADFHQPAASGGQISQIALRIKERRRFGAEPPLGGPKGGLQLQVNGLPGKDYILQASTNFKNWTALQTNVAVPNPSVSLPTKTKRNFGDSFAAVALISDGGGAM